MKPTPPILTCKSKNEVIDHVYDRLIATCRESGCKTAGEIIQDEAFRLFFDAFDLNKKHPTLDTKLFNQIEGKPLLSGTQNPTQHIRKFQKGLQRYQSNGDAIMGVGYYFTESHPTARGYAGNKEDGIMIAKLAKDAKIIRYDDLEDMRDSYFSSYETWSECLDDKLITAKATRDYKKKIITAFFDETQLTSSIFALYGGKDAIYQDYTGSEKDTLIIRRSATVQPEYHPTYENYKSFNEKIKKSIDNTLLSI